MKMLCVVHVVCKMKKIFSKRGADSVYSSKVAMLRCWQAPKCGRCGWPWCGKKGKREERKLKQDGEKTGRTEETRKKETKKESKKKKTNKNIGNKSVRE